MSPDERRLDAVDALLVRARAGHDVRAEVDALPEPLRGEVREALEAQGVLLAAIGAPAPGPPPGDRRGDPFVGAVLSGCTLERCLGRGGMGAAYLARRADGLAVVVKLLASAGDANLRARLRREAAALRRLRAHPHLVAVLAADVEGEGDVPPHLVLELAPGVPLRALVGERGRLAPLAAARVARDVAMGLAVMHGHGLLHRDVKPENVVVSPEGRARLIDLGIAKDAFLTGLTAPGQLVGTAEYMAPEQWTSAPLDARTDVFALGATLYFALCGRPPFGGSLDELMQAATDGDFAPPRELAPDCPAELEAIVTHALDPEPRFRYARVEAMAEDLELVLGGAPPTNLPALVEARGRRHALVAARRFLVGQDPRADIPLEARGVAREHAEVRREASGYSITDLRGSGGTFVGDERVVRGRALEDADVVRVGEATLRFSDPGGRRRPPPVLEDLARSERPDAVVSALVRLGDARTIAALLELLEPDPLVERAAEEVMRACAGDAAPGLLARRARIAAEARAAAPALLQAVSGEALGLDPVAWLSWWFQSRGRYESQVGPIRPPRALRLVPARGAPAALLGLAGEPGVLLVGRDERCHVRLEEPTVSRLHATVLRLHRRLVVRDEGSAGATFLDGAPVHVGFLDPGATLRLGDVTVAVEGQDLVAPGAEGLRPVDPATFQALDEAGHDCTLHGHVAVLEAASRVDADLLARELSPEAARRVGEAWRARAARARQALAARLGHDVGPDPHAWRVALRGSALPPQVAPVGWT